MVFFRFSFKLKTNTGVFVSENNFNSIEKKYAEKTIKNKTNGKPLIYNSHALIVIMIFLYRLKNYIINQTMMAAPQTISLWFSRSDATVSHFLPSDRITTKKKVPWYVIKFHVFHIIKTCPYYFQNKNHSTMIRVHYSKRQWQRDEKKSHSNKKIDEKMKYFYAKSFSSRFFLSTHSVSINFFPHRLLATQIVDKNAIIGNFLLLPFFL